MKSEWKLTKLKDLVEFNPRESLAKGTLAKKVTMSDLVEKKRKIRNFHITEYKGGTLFRNGDILFARITPSLENGKIAQVDILEDNEIGFGSTEFIVWRAIAGVSDPGFVYYLANYGPIVETAIRSMSGTSGRQRVQLDALKDFACPVPPLRTQKAIADTLSCLDAKIDLNIRINDNLEKQAQAIFKNWFVDFEPFLDAEFVDSSIGPIPDGWIVKALDEVADYVNGLAMQRYRPQDNEEGLPVIKIRELRQGFADESSDRCTAAIEDDYVIDDGDIVFSWSGTLMVDIWTGGRAGLNQHLFKVSSRNYPRWFYYLWTKFHIEYFRHIADSRATTMGHIKRSHLKEAKVLVPDAISLEWMTALMEPLIDMQMTRRMENRVLASLRDVLRPALLSGEIEVPVVY